MAHTEAEIETLNSFLRTETSAVEAYRRALRAVHNDLARRAMEGAQKDHEARVESLRERITGLGGTPAMEHGEAWGPIDGDERKAIATLEQCEGRELNDIERELPRVHGEARRFMRMELLPRQKRIAEQMSRLKRTIH